MRTGPTFTILVQGQCSSFLRPFPLQGVLKSDWNGVGNLEQGYSGDILRIQSIFKVFLDGQQVAWSWLLQNMSHFVMIKATLTFYFENVSNFQESWKSSTVTLVYPSLLLRTVVRILLQMFYLLFTIFGSIWWPNRTSNLSVP